MDCACRQIQFHLDNPCRFYQVFGKPLPLSVDLSTQSGKEKLAHLLLLTLHPHQQR
jgi:hypothetical protein